MNAAGKICLTSTELNGRFAIRLMTGVRTTEKEHIEAAVKTLVEIAEEAMGEVSQSNQPGQQQQRATIGHGRHAPRMIML